MALIPRRTSLLPEQPTVGMVPVSAPAQTGYFPKALGGVIDKAAEIQDIQNELEDGIKRDSAITEADIEFFNHGEEYRSVPIKDSGPAFEQYKKNMIDTTKRIVSDIPGVTNNFRRQLELDLLKLASPNLKEAGAHNMLAIFNNRMEAGREAFRTHIANHDYDQASISLAELIAHGIDEQSATNLGYTLAESKFGTYLRVSIKANNGQYPTPEAVSKLPGFKALDAARQQHILLNATVSQMEQLSEETVAEINIAIDEEVEKPVSNLSDLMIRLKPHLDKLPETQQKVTKRSIKNAFYADKVKEITFSVLANKIPYKMGVEIINRLSQDLYGERSVDEDLFNLEKKWHSAKILVSTEQRMEIAEDVQNIERMIFEFGDTVQGGDANALNEAWKAINSEINNMAAKHGGPAWASGLELRRRLGTLWGEKYRKTLDRAVIGRHMDQNRIMHEHLQPILDDMSSTELRPFFREYGNPDAKYDAMSFVKIHGTLPEALIDHHLGIISRLPDGYKEWSKPENAKDQLAWVSAVRVIAMTGHTSDVVKGMVTEEEWFKIFLLHKHMEKGLLPSTAAQIYNSRIDLAASDKAAEALFGDVDGEPSPAGGMLDAYWNNLIGKKGWSIGGLIRKAATPLLVTEEDRFAREKLVEHDAIDQQVFETLMIEKFKSVMASISVITDLEKEIPSSLTNQEFIKNAMEAAYRSVSAMYGPDNWNGTTRMGAMTVGKRYRDAPEFAGISFGDWVMEGLEDDEFMQQLERSPELMKLIEPMKWLYDPESQVDPGVINLYAFSQMFGAYGDTSVGLLRRIMYNIRKKSNFTTPVLNAFGAALRTDSGETAVTNASLGTQKFFGVGAEKTLNEYAGLGGPTLVDPDGQILYKNLVAMTELLREKEDAGRYKKSWQDEHGKDLVITVEEAKNVIGGALYDRFNVQLEPNWESKKEDMPALHEKYYPIMNAIGLDNNGGLKQQYMDNNPKPNGWSSEDIAAKEKELMDSIITNRTLGTYGYIMSWIPDVSLSKKDGTDVQRISKGVPLLFKRPWVPNSINQNPAAYRRAWRRFAAANNLDVDVERQGIHTNQFFGHQYEGSIPSIDTIVTIPEEGFEIIVKELDEDMAASLRNLRDSARKHGMITPVPSNPIPSTNPRHREVYNK